MIVSLCVIAYNEEKFLPDLLKNIVQQDYPHGNIEVILIDGASNDKTKYIMNNFQNDNNSFLRVVVLNNTKRIQAAGWNIAINASKGDVIIRVDAHALIPNDFISKNIKCIESGEMICGGRRINIISEQHGCKQVLLMAENSMFGSGIAPYRRTTDKKYVKTLAHACYRREIFEQVGVFNEQLIRTEDNEMHYRIRLAGYRFCLAGDIVSYYQTRSTLSSMLRQKFGNGKWIGITAKLSPSIFSIYHFVPFLFVLGLFITLSLFVSSLFNMDLRWLGYPFICLSTVYVLLNVLLTIKAAWEYRRPVGLILLPFLFPLLHISYGLGTLTGFLVQPKYHLKDSDDSK